MTNAKTIWMMAVVLSLAGSPALGYVDFDDGLVHDIDYVIDDTVRVDYMAPGAQTTVNLLDGGSINYYLYGYENSHINILGGSIGDDLRAYDSSEVYMSGGSIGDDLRAFDTSEVYMSGGSIDVSFYADNSSQVDISGGSIAGFLSAYASSQVDISGGSIGIDLIAYGSSRIDISGGSARDMILSDLAIMTIHGSDFAVNGLPFGYGDLTSTLGGDWWHEPNRRLTGTLASAEPIDNAFDIGYDAKIVLVPEPATVALLGLGALNLIRRKRRA